MADIARFRHELEQVRPNQLTSEELHQLRNILRQGTDSQADLSQTLMKFGLLTQMLKK